MNFKKLVVFDLDGTLNKTELYAVPAHQKALHELGVTNISDADIIATFGARAEDSYHLLVGTTDPDILCVYMQKVSQYEREMIKTNAGSYDGVPQMLAGLKKRGFFTAVCSNSSERYIRMVLSNLGILKYIDDIQPLIPGLKKEDTLRLLLERMKPDRAVMIGDRSYDQSAALKNGLPFIGCLYGFRPEEMCHADAVIKDASEIPDAVERLMI